MRMIALVLATLMAMACGGDDEPEDTRGFQAPGRPGVDTTLGDTAGTDADRPDTTGTTDDLDTRPGGPGGPDGPDGGAVADPQDGASEADAGPERTARSGGPSDVEAPRGEGADAAPPDRRLYTVQVAAFTERSSAAEWEERLRQQGLPVWSSVHEVGGRTFHRLRVGAAPTVSEARTLGRMLTERYEWPVWIAPVAPADRVPEGAEQATRGLVDGR